MTNPHRLFFINVFRSKCRSEVISMRMCDILIEITLTGNAIQFS